MTVGITRRICDFLNKMFPAFLAASNLSKTSFVIIDVPSRDGHPGRSESLNVFPFFSRSGYRSLGTESCGGSAIPIDLYLQLSGQVPVDGIQHQLEAS